MGIEAVVRLTPWATVVLTRAVVASEDMEDRTVVSQTEIIEEAVAAAAVVLSMPADPTVNHHHRNNNMAKVMVRVVEILLLSEVETMASTMVAESRIRVCLMVQRTLCRPTHQQVKEKRIDGL